MSRSANRIVSRREALSLSVSAGVGLAAGRSALTFDSANTAGSFKPDVSVAQTAGI
jgi:hypothetical protein